jgi:hypothetical protein
MGNSPSFYQKIIYNHPAKSSTDQWFSLPGLGRCIQLGPCNRVAVAVASQEGRRTTPAAQAQTGASLVADAVDALEELGAGRSYHNKQLDS